MFFIRIVFLSLFISLAITSKISDSIVPSMKDMSAKAFQGKVSKEQMNYIKKIEKLKKNKILIMSFNMLFNLQHKEELLETDYHWSNRLPRIVEYLQFVKPDIIGSQELYKDQVKDLMRSISDKYEYYGAKRNKDEGELQAIFFDKNRFELIEGRTYYYSKSSLTLKPSSYNQENVLTYCVLLDKKTNKKLIVLNTHFSFFNAEKRLTEAKFIKNFINSLPDNLPIIVTGDFNTFPMNANLNLPFSDGSFVLEIITNDSIDNSMDRAALGHLGPITSTNVSNKTKQAFQKEGTPGVILDFIFVNKNVYVRSHGIDPVKVNDKYMSDHLPVLAEVIIK